MNEIMMLLGDKPREILQSVINERIAVSISYLSNRRWHRTRALLLELDSDSFLVKISPKKKANQIDIPIGHLIGVSFKYGFGGSYDRFIFGTTVSRNKESENISKVMRLAVPEEIEVVQARSFLRIAVPQYFDIDVHMQHHSFTIGQGDVFTAQVKQTWQGKLINISADGLKVSVNLAQGPDFQKNQYFKISFTSFDHETPLTFDAYVSDFSPSLEGNNICYDLHIVGLEASPEGRMVLQRICNVLSRYLQINQQHAPANQQAYL